MYVAEEAKGFVQVNDSKAEVEVALDSRLSTSLADLDDVAALRVWTDTEPFPLRWGEVVPLLLTREGGYRPRRHVILSFPLLHGRSDSDMIPELLRLGKDLRFALHRQRYAVLVSGDLAHAHDVNGPYGYSPTADPYEAAIVTWLRNITDTSALLSTAASLVDTALSCSFMGLVLLFGILQDDLHSYANAGPIVGPFHPTYYGMACASWVNT